MGPTVRQSAPAPAPPPWRHGAPGRGLPDGPWIEPAVSAIARPHGGATSPPPSRSPGSCVRAWPTPTGEQHRPAQERRRRQARGAAQRPQSCVDHGAAKAHQPRRRRERRGRAARRRVTPDAPVLPLARARRPRARAASFPPPSTVTRWRKACPPGKQSRGSSPPPPRAAPGRQAPACGLIMPTGNELTVPFLLTTYGTLWYTK
jgi:hypothetical protein